MRVDPALYDQLAHLESLARHVEAIPPLRATITNGSQRGELELEVVNPEHPHLAQRVACALQADDHEYWYVWRTWENTIGPASDPFGVAMAVFRVVSGLTSA